MKVKFLQDHCGRETAMQTKKVGEEMEMVHTSALELIACGVVEEVHPEEEPKRKVRRDKNSQ